MIPFIHVPDLKIGPLTLHPFGLLVATGVILGTWLATRRARARGLDLNKLNSFITWMLVAGFLGGHMLDQLFYHWPEFVKRPWSIFLLYEGLSSFGGFTGAVIGGTLWKYFEAVPIGRVPLLGFTIPRYRRRQLTMPILPFADIILSVFPVAWVFGRSGCSVVHDHPGMAAAPGTLLAVAFGRPSRIMKILSLGTGDLELRWGTAPQFDLGLLEMMFTVILATMLALTWRRKLTTGTYVAVTSLCYSPVRFAMDYLRVRDVEQADPRFGGLTPAQWSCVALFVFGLVMVARVRQIKKSGSDPQDLLLAPAPGPLPEGSADPETAWSAGSRARSTTTRLRDYATTGTMCRSRAARTSAGSSSFVIVRRFVQTTTFDDVAIAVPSLARVNAKWRWHEVVPILVTVATMRAASP